MTSALGLPAGIRSAIIDHARAEAPREACGLVAGTAPHAAGGRATTWHPTRNRLASELRFEIHPDDLRDQLLALDGRGEIVFAIVHSHVRSPAVPSPTDLAGAAWWPGTIHVIVSLDPSAADPKTGEPSIRAWEIAAGVAAELETRLMADDPPGDSGIARSR